MSADARYLLAGFSTIQPRTRSGACFNAGCRSFEDTARGDAAMGELLRAGAIVDRGHGWYLLA